MLIFKVTSSSRKEESAHIRISLRMTDRLLKPILW